jgi:hypothetical protein
MTLHRDYSWLATLVVLSTASVLGAGCSAIIDANPDSLPDAPGSDGGRTDGGRTDAGVRDDGGPLDAPITPDLGGVCAGGCDDGISCTIDVCGAGGCTHAPSDAACGPTERCSVILDCVARLCESDASCDDGLFCNGSEHCNVGGAGADPTTGCMAGVAPTCTDAFGCSVDVCDEASGACLHVPNDAACDDGVSCTTDACNPGASTIASGCVATPNDALCDGACATVGGNPALRPGLCRPAWGGCTLGAAVACTDTDPCTMDTCTTGTCGVTPLDRDGDGFVAQSASGVSCGGTDCNDGSAAVNPGATEICNGFDDNCNGVVDEGCTATLPDDCATAVALTASGGGVYTASGDFASFADNYRVSCGGVGGRDAVYYFDLTSLSDVVITTFGGTADTVLAVGTTCSATGFALGCDDDIVPTVTIASRIFLHRMGPMPGPGSTPLRVYVLVDTYESSTMMGSFTVTATVTAATPDSCTGPINISQGGTLVGEIGFAPGVGQSGSCQPMADLTDPEAVAAFSGSTDGTEVFAATSTTFNPTLYVREATCGSAGAEDACVLGTAGTAGGTATLNANVPTGTNGFLFIDNANAGGRSRYVVDYTP